MALVLVFFCAPLFVNLGATDFENDESIYAFAVDVMLEDGDWLTPKSIHDVTRAFLQKPPLKFWITALPVYLGWLPADEFGYRFMDAVMGSLAILYLFAIGRRIGGPVAGLAAAFLLFTQERLLFEHGIRTDNMESTLLLAYCGGVYHFLAWRSGNPEAKWHIFGMTLWCAFGFMTKFVAVAFLPGILVLATMLRRADRVRLYRDRRIFAMAAMVAIALVAPWFVYQSLEQGRRVYRVMLGVHVMKRFTAYLDPAHLQPWNFYFLEIWAELQRAGSQIVVGLGCLFVLLKTVRRRWTEGAVLVLWFGLPLAVMSTTTSKLYHYAHPFLPPLALAGGAFAAFVAGWIFRVLDRPVAAYDALRTRLFGAWPPRSMEIAATGAGLLAFVLAAFTAAFERIGFAVGSTAVRSSSIARPALAGVLALAVAAPASVLQALVVTAAISPVMPLAAYKASLQRTKFEYKAHREVRACLMRVMEAQKTRGQAPPGVWVEARSQLRCAPGQPNIDNYT